MGKYHSTAVLLFDWIGFYQGKKYFVLACSKATELRKCRCIEQSSDFIKPRIGIDFQARLKLAVQLRISFFSNDI